MAMTISQLLLPEFDQEMATTRRVLESLPDDKLDYRPHEKSFTMARLAAHVAEMPAWIASLPGQDKLVIPADFKPAVAESREQLLAFFDDNVAKGRAALAQLSDEELGQNWSIEFAGRGGFGMPKLKVVRTVVMNHMIHHRAQLGVYYRLNGVPVPGMYGPSADEQKNFA